MYTYVYIISLQYVLMMCSKCETCLDHHSCINSYPDIHHTTTRYTPKHSMIESYFLSPYMIEAILSKRKAQFKLDLYYYTQLKDPIKYRLYLERNPFITYNWLKMHNTIINWKLFSKFQPTFNIYKFCEHSIWRKKIVWNIILRHHTLHKWFIIKYFSFMNTSLLCMYQYLDNRFIMSHLPFLDIDLILRYQYITDKSLRKKLLLSDDLN